jgi:hypothetical protein
MRTRLIVYPLLLAVFVGAIYVWAVRPVQKEFNQMRAEAEEAGRRAYKHSRKAWVYIGGTRGTPFTGSLAIVYRDRAQQESIEGRVPTKYIIEACDSVSVSAQKQREDGTLKVEISDPPGQTVTSHTSAPYGVASVALTH